MRTFLVTSASFAGEIEYRYDNCDRLDKFDIRASLTPEQYACILGHIPISPKEAIIFFRKMEKTVKIVEVLGEVSFEQFWQKYGSNRGNSSKKRAEIKWEKMHTAEQIKAYRYMDTYFVGIQNGTCAKHVETYLNAELWNN